MSGADASDLLDLVVQRGPLLRRIRAGARRKSTLVETETVSRSTVDRGIRELEGAGLLERSDDTYRPTVVGRVALEAYEEFVDRIEGLSEGMPAIRDLPPGAPLDRSVVRDPETVAVAEPPDPGRPTRVQRSLVQRSTHQRLLAPMVLPQHVDMYHEAVTNGTLTGKFLVTTDVLEWLITNYSDRVQDALDRDGVSVREATSLPPYGLTVSETGDGRVVGLFSFAEPDVSAFLSAENDRAVAWATDLFERHWDGARPIEG